MKIETLLLPSAVLAGITLLLPRGFAYLDRASKLRDRVESFDMAPLIPYIDSTTFREDRAFWIASNRVAGLIQRQLRAVLMIRELENRIRVGAITRDDAIPAYSMALMQLWFTTLAIAEALICLCFRKVPHIAARAATSIHWNLDLRCTNLSELTPVNCER